MFLKNLHSGLNRNAAPAQRQGRTGNATPTQHRPKRFRPVLEALEERTLLAGDSAGGPQRPDGMAPGMVPEPAAVVDEGESHPSVPAASPATAATENRLRNDYKAKLISFCGRGTLDEVFWARDGRSGVVLPKLDWSREVVDGRVD